MSRLNTTNSTKNIISNYDLILNKKFHLQCHSNFKYLMSDVIKYGSLVNIAEFLHMCAPLVFQLCPLLLKSPFIKFSIRLFLSCGS